MSVVHCAPNKQVKQAVRIMHDVASVVIVNLENFAHAGIMQVLWHIQRWLYFKPGYTFDIMSGLCHIYQTQPFRLQFGGSTKRLTPVLEHLRDQKLRVWIIFS